jgi:hypothetical protein
MIGHRTALVKENRNPDTKVFLAGANWTFWGQLNR